MDGAIFKTIMRAISTLTTLLILSLASSTFAALPVVINSGPASCSGGETYVNGGSIDNTSFDTVYDSECHFPSGGVVTVSDADILAGNTYTVYLHFAEIWFGDGNAAFGEGDGARVFHVDIEGTRVLTNFDIHANVGPRMAMGMKYDVIALENGSIDITFTNVTQNAKISAIEVMTLGSLSTMTPDNGFQDLNSSPFPVEWAHLEVNNKEDAAVINWQTAWESNNLGFEIQINPTGNSFETIGFVEGIGTTTEVSDYSFTTESLMPGAYRFRLKQIDMDGRISISPSMELSIRSGSALTFLPLKPNPATYETEWSLETSGSDHIRVSIRNTFGQEINVLYDGEAGSAGILRQTLNVSTLTPGVYFLQMNSNGTSDVQRLVVTN